MYVSNAERNRELKHHGILGMKWGKRNGPPYPLNPADHSAAEKKAGYQKSIDKGSSSGTDKKKSSDSKPEIKSKEGSWNKTKSFGSEYEWKENSDRITYKSNSEKKKNLDRIAGDDSDAHVQALAKQFGYSDKEIKDQIERGDWADYSEAEDNFDLKAMWATDIYAKEGKKAALEYIHNQFKDYDYDFEFIEYSEKYIDNGKEFVEKYAPSWRLTIEGDKFGYKSAGDSDYSDDQYFYKKEKK